jgi:hypothetical protein
MLFLPSPSLHAITLRKRPSGRSSTLKMLYLSFSGALYAKAWLAAE